MGTKVILIYIIIWFISSFFITIPSLDLQERKGYEGNFLFGLLFGIIYLIYSAGLPLKKDDCSDRKQTNKKENKKIKNISQIKSDENNNHYSLCPKCGFPTYTDEEICSNCGNPNNHYKKD